jgi:hypothetical protein
MRTIAASHPFNTKNTKKRCIKGKHLLSSAGV